jgi:phosphate:Na+ symporter
MNAFLAGLVLTALLQSSTATGLMATSFAASGIIDLASGLAVMLGANVGTTLIVQVLSFNIGVVAPILILAGVVLFRRGGDGQVKNLGRIAIGLGLMLLALNLLVRTMSPIEQAPEIRGVLEALVSQPVLAMVLAATHLGVSLKRGDRSADSLPGKGGHPGAYPGSGLGPRG